MNNLKDVKTLDKRTKVPKSNQPQTPRAARDQVTLSLSGNRKTRKTSEFLTKPHHIISHHHLLSLLASF
jgi:hypothetical protein